MTVTIFGIRKDSKEEEPGKEKEKVEKEKEDKVEDSSDLEPKAKEKERERKNHLAGHESYWAQDEWQGNETENWNEGNWAYEDETAWQSQGWDEWQEDYYDDYGYYQGKGKRRKKGKGKGKKGHGPQQDQGKGQGDGKGKANYVSPSQCSSQSSMQLAALPSLSNASGLFVTHSSVDLASVKMRESEEQQKEPDLSGCAFLGQELKSC